MGYERFNAYTIYEEYMCHHAIYRMPPRKKFAFYGAVRQTLVALQLRSSPQLKAHLSSDTTKRAIREEMRKWMLYEHRSNTDDNWYWVMLRGTLFDNGLYQRDAGLKYMMGNIGCTCPVLVDITEVRRRC